MIGRAAALIIPALLLASLVPTRAAEPSPLPRATKMIRAAGEATIQGGDMDAARKAAMAAAVRAAAEDAVLSHLDEMTRAESGERIRALVRERGAGFARAMRLTEDGAQGQTYRVAGEFEVQLLPILQVLTEGKALPARRALVSIPERYLVAPVPDPAGEAEIVRRLLAAGVAIAVRPDGLRLGHGATLEMALESARAANADVLVLGTASADGGGAEMQGIRTAQARLDVQVIQVATGEVLARETGTGAGAGAGAVSAQAAVDACRKAVSRAAALLAPRLVAAVLLSPAPESRVSLDAGPFPSLTAAGEFERALVGVAGIRRAARRSYAEGTLALDLQVAPAAAAGLAEALEKAEALRDYGIVVTLAERGRLRIRVRGPAVPRADAR